MAGVFIYPLWIRRYLGIRYRWGISIMDKKILVFVMDKGFSLWTGGYRYPLWIRRYSLWMGDIHHGLEDIRYGWGISIMDKEIFLMDGGLV